MSLLVKDIPVMGSIYVKVLDKINTEYNPGTLDVFCEKLSIKARIQILCHSHRLKYEILYTLYEQDAFKEKMVISFRNTYARGEHSVHVTTPVIEGNHVYRRYRGNIISNYSQEIYFLFQELVKKYPIE